MLEGSIWLKKLKLLENGENFAYNVEHLTIKTLQQKKDREENIARLRKEDERMKFPFYLSVFCYRILKEEN